MREVAIHASLGLALSLTCVAGVHGQCDFEKLQPAVPLPEMSFGACVRLDGSTIAVGAPEASAVKSLSTGAVHVFEELGGSWVEWQRLELPVSEQEAGDRFGAAVDRHLSELDVRVERPG